jgi:hypothetical protein
VEVIAFPPEFDPIPIFSRRLRGVIAHLFEHTYGPKEMLTEKAAKRVEMELTGEAAKNSPPLLDGPFDPLQEHDPIFLVVYYFMAKRHAANLAPYRGHTTALMEATSKAAPTFGVPARLIPDNSSVYGRRLKSLMPQFARVGLRLKRGHDGEGSLWVIAWECPPPTATDLSEGGDQPSSLPSEDNTFEIKPLRRSDGSDVTDVLSRLASLGKEHKETRS